MSGIPAFVRNSRLDILGINAMGRALYSQAFDSPTRPVKHRAIRSVATALAAPVRI